ncbi:MAG: DMT family transporter [Meiothermus sp.]|uniref:DMT family transporter n=1 Tax=Meiothermus sp. TaxID=1955249 RepID=UPI002620A9D0|nr:DMT family transporter [Meiothermus sp.]MCS7058075.1 DMT family transporter [Meiothermus sp.]MCX7740300.1 DMT family transporter [Meiothermus sp.]
MSFEMAAVGLALLSALSWGAGDFSGGLAARKLSPYRVALLVQITGFSFFVLMALGRGENLYPSDLPWSLAAGAAGCLGLVFLYRAFQAGQMGLAAPVAGVVGASLAALVGVFLEGTPAPVQLWGFGVGLLGVWLASQSGEFGRRSLGLGYAALAGLGFGGYFVLIDRVEGLFWPSAFAKLTAAVLVLGWALRAFPGPRQELGRYLPLLILAGLLDAGGNVLFLAAAQAGRLDVAAVLSSLYPAFTAVLAWALLRERLRPGQNLGVLLSLVAIALIAAG